MHTTPWIHCWHDSEGRHHALTALYLVNAYIDCRQDEDIAARNYLR
jgi:hypothetical protein